MKVTNFTKIMKDHAYAVIYKDKCVKACDIVEPLNKDEWQLRDIHNMNMLYNESPFHPEELEMLLNDNDVTIIDLGPQNEIYEDLDLAEYYHLLKTTKGL